MSNSSKSNPSKAWLLPEFGLITHVHNTTHKKLKARSKINSDVNAFANNQEIQNAIQKGYEEGKNKANMEMQGMIKELANLLSIIKKQASNNEEKATLYHDLIKNTCRAIINKEIEVCPDIVISYIKEALNVIDDDNSIVIYCSEKLIGLINQEAKGDLLNNQNIQFEKDLNLVDYHFNIESQKQHLTLDFSKLIDKLLNEHYKPGL